MNEIKCPNCGKLFQIDEKDYNSIVKQIRDHEFEEELKIREKQVIKEKNNELELLKIMSGQELYTDMVSFADLSDAVKKLGYESNSYQINRENLDKLVNIPMLVKIEDDPRFPHFVIIINHKGNYLQVLDPSHGEYISSKSQFFSIWDRYNKGGYALIVAPKKELKPFKLNTPKSLHFDFSPFSLY